MKFVNDNEEIKSIISDNKMVVLYFSNNICGACEVIGRKIEEILEAYTQVKLLGVDGENNIETAALYDVFSFPLMILFVYGKETIRVGRNVDFNELENNINRYYDMMK